MMNATHTILNIALSTLNTTFNKDNADMTDLHWPKGAIAIGLLAVLVPLFILCTIWFICCSCIRRRREYYAVIPDTQQSEEVGELYFKPFCLPLSLHVCPQRSV